MGRSGCGPSVAIFPAWSFGTSGEVRVAIPSGYEMRVDGDPLTEDGDTLVSGPIEDPAAWLALVTAVAPAELASHEATVPLEGGTADLVVRAFTDDEEWGTRTLDTVSAALPLIEAELGLPYPLRGQLILVESVPATIAGFGESSTTGAEIPVSFDQPPFTALHQVAHVWLPPSLVESRWISEGLASQVAAAVAGGARRRAALRPGRRGGGACRRRLPARRLVVDAGSRGRRIRLRRVVGVPRRDRGRRRARRRSRACSLASPPRSGRTSPPRSRPSRSRTAASDPAAPLTSRSFLDHLETVTDADLAPLFADRVLGEADVALLGPRADAREAFDALVASADGWGAPDPVASAMADWRFDEAVAQIADASAWLADRDELLEQMAEAGLSAPDRLHQAYRAYGGGAEAESELESERDVVEAYVAAAARVNAERSLIERLGLVGGHDPEKQLAMANGQFTEGDLSRSLASIAEAERIVDQAATAGVVRLVSLLLLVLITVGLVIVLFRRRAYTAPR